MSSQSSVNKSPAPQTVASVLPADINLSPTTEQASSHSSPQVISTDCYMVVANDADATAILDLDAFVLDDVMMTDEQEIVGNQLLM